MVIVIVIQYSLVWINGLGYILKHTLSSPYKTPLTQMGIQIMQCSPCLTPYTLMDIQIIPCQHWMFFNSKQVVVYCTTRHSKKGIISIKDQFWLAKTKFRLIAYEILGISLW
jgi:hypothetical protein